METGRGQRNKKGRIEWMGIRAIVSTKGLNGPSMKGITGKRRQFRERKGQEKGRKKRE